MVVSRWAEIQKDMLIILLVSGCACVQTSGANNEDPMSDSPKSSVKSDGTLSRGTSRTIGQDADQAPAISRGYLVEVKLDESATSDRPSANGQAQAAQEPPTHQAAVNVVVPTSRPSTSQTIPADTGHYLQDPLPPSRKRKHITPEPELIAKELSDPLAGPKRPAGKSCCAPSSTSLEVAQQGAATRAPVLDVRYQRHPSTDGHMPQAATHSAFQPLPPRPKTSLPPIGNGGYLDPRNVPYTTLYPLPPNYATAQNPMTVGQHFLHQQNILSNAQAVPSYAPSGLMGSAALPSTEASAYASMHNCTCGPGCQCLFCAVHPYNSATLQQVHNIAHHLPIHENVSADLPQSPSGHRNRTGPNQTQSVQAYTPLNHASSQHSPSVLQPPAGFADTPQHSSPPQSDPQYFTLTYQINAADLHSCTNTSGSCRCGDECACVGCLTHTGHTGEALDLNALQT